MPRARMDPDVKARLLAVTTVEADHRSGRHLIVEQVRRWIFEGLLRDGDVISQEDLAEILGTSRIPVRDGLISLEHGGWVIIEPGIGARAVGLDAAAVRDTFDLLGHIWCLLIRRVVERDADTEEIHTASKQVARARTAIQMTNANQQFVTALRGAAHAPRLNAAFQNAGRIVPGDFFATVPHAMPVQRAHVPAMGAAIRAGDVDDACRLALSQHATHANNIVALLRRRGVLITTGA